MATPERIAPSRRLRGAALAERERAHRQLERVENRLAALRAELEKAERLRDDLRQRLALLAHLVYDAEEDSPFLLHAVQTAQEPGGSDDRPAPRGVLRGADIRIAAARILASSESPSRPIHYARWFELVREAGYGIGGRDPAATFLTQITRSPVIQRAGAPGIYALDFDAPERLRDRLSVLNRALLQLHEGQQTFEGMATERERRVELAAEYDRAERALAEALEALGLPAVSPPTSWSSLRPPAACPSSV